MHSMALRRSASIHLPWIILFLAWKMVSVRTFLILLCGFLLGWVSRYVRRVTHYLTSSQDSGTLYNFEHGVLNLPVDCKSMWMNMGYWKRADSFDAACQLLLEKILCNAGLGLAEGDAIRTRRPRLVLELGYGCGDSSIYLATPVKTPTNVDGAVCYIADEYVGLTLDPRQHDLALKRMQKFRSSVSDYVGVTLLCEDAATPSTWSASLKTRLQSSVQGMTIRTSATESVRPRIASPRNELTMLTSGLRNIAAGPRRQDHDINILVHNSPRTPAAQRRTPTAQQQTPTTQQRTNTSRPGNDARTETWVLAVDCLYHFHPSREEIFRYSNRELGASIMAFDLILSPDISTSDRIKLWIISLFISAPLSNFMIESEYRRQLQASGYSEDKIVMEDITEHCFSKLAQFLDRREQDLSKVGIHSFERFRLAKWMFRWFANTKVVRAYVVVAKIR